MRHVTRLFLVCMCLTLEAEVVCAQTKVTDSNPVSVTLSVGQKQTFEIAARPGDIELFRLQLKGGLLAIQSAEAPRRVLDLGCGGELLYAVTSSNDGVAHIELSSAEQARPAIVTILDVTDTRTQEVRQHLHAAGVAFAQADYARRRQPGALDGPTALRAYDSATAEAEAANDIPLARWAMTQKARYLIYQKSSFFETRALLTQAAALPDDDTATLALTYKTLSSAEYFMGNLSASVDAGEHALALYKKTGDVYWQGIVLGNLVSFYGESGRDDEAIAAGREALADSEQTQDTAGVVFSLTELGDLYEQQGKYQLAFQTFRDAMAWGESIHYAPKVEAEIEKSLGLFYFDLGLWDEAQTQFQLCLHHATADGEDALEARGMLARILEQRGDSSGALREYHTTIAIAEKLQLRPEEVALLLRRSSALLRVGQTVPAQKDVVEALRLADVLNLPTLQIDTALAEGALQERICASCPDAKNAYERARFTAQETGEREQEAAADAGLARVYAAHHDYSAALQSIEQSLSIVEHSRASLSSHDLAASYFTSRHDWYSFAIDTCMHLDQISPKQGYAEMSFRYAERARARAMLDAIGEEGWEAGSALPSNLRQKMLANRHQIDNQKALLLTSADPRKAATDLHALYREEDALTAEAIGQPGKLPREGRDGIASAKDIQQILLGSDAALLAFSPGTTHSYRWLITSTSISVASLPAASELDRRMEPLQKMLVERKPQPRIEEDVEHFRSRVAEWNRVRDDALERAGELLIPVLPSGVRHLYIVADGSLLSLPWSALRLPCGQRTCYAVERFATALEPSASVAVSLTQRQAKITGHDVVVIADTIASHDGATLRWAPLPPLPGSRREANAIARLVPAASFHQLSGDKATVENVHSLTQGNVAVLHFATHTILVPGHPELSGIALSSGRQSSGGAAQSVLWLRDIPSLHAPPIVTLSGCTTQGHGLSGEELKTLTQAFFYAGAQQVIGSIWSVDDESTVGLMEDFYRHLFVQKMDASDAMRQAQLSLLHNDAPLSDWAGFVVDGVTSRTTRILIGGR